MNRRTYLAITTATIIPLTGCVNGFGPFGGSSSSSEPFDTNPATNNIDRNPVLGSSDDRSESTIVAFEDPSCPICKQFTEDTFPKLRTNLLESGQTKFVYRSYPHVEEWSNAAVNVLYAVNAQSNTAFWKLNEYMYREQDDISKGTIHSISRAFLRERTSVDPKTAIGEAKNHAYSDIISSDTTAVEEANVGGTPTFFLFKDGAFVTTIVGNENYRVFKNALA